jgi:TM2 domain-containing membrane protein YozV
MSVPVPAAFTERYMSLTDQQRMRFDMQYQAEAKSPDTGLICAIFGVFYFYMGQTGKAIAQLISYLFVIGIIWWIITLVGAKREVVTHNTAVAQRILTGIH